ncbi:MAG: hypothetical protein KHY61_07080, partial [Sutterella wadsworthensis]|nr:hypothetical protein [Sutterella wadsworthensis]
MQSYFETLAARQNLSREDARALFAQIFEGKLDAAQLAACLTALKMKGILRNLMPRTYFLVPGYGAQGGTAEDLKHCFNK